MVHMKRCKTRDYNNKYILYWFNNIKNIRNPSAHVFGTLIAELFGSFLFFLFVCVQMNKKTEVSASPIISSLFISTIFYIAREYK